jgi:hypothetical protein
MSNLLPAASTEAASQYPPNRVECGADPVVGPYTSWRIYVRDDEVHVERPRVRIGVDGGLRMYCN